VRILADENLDGPIVEWLRANEFDVLWIAEQKPGVPDEDVIGEAKSTDRVLLTFDRDFGSLVFRSGHRAEGVVLLRLRAKSSEEILQLFIDWWPSIEPKARGNFIVVSNGRMRVRPMPD
jgi:predicted nuclease of predicted toxin-antitoxin system